MRVLRFEGVDSDGASFENVPSVGSNDVTDGMIANVNEMSFSGFFLFNFFMA